MRVLNCTFPAGCSYGAYLAGNSSTRPTGIEISGCTMTPLTSPMYLAYWNDLKFNNNTVTRNSAASGVWYGLYINYSDGAMQVMNNNINAGTPNSTYYGFLRQYCNGTAAARQLIANNTFTVTNNSGQINNLYFYNCRYDSTVGNTFTASTITSTTHYSNYIWYCDYIYLKNNTFTITSTTSGTIYSIQKYYGQTNTSGKSLGDVFEGNTYTATSTSTASLYIYYYQSDGMKFKNNTINHTTNGSIYSYYYYPINYEFSGNTITNKSNGTGTVYGAYLIHDSGASIFAKIFNNKITAMSNATGSYVYGFYVQYPTDCDIYNNTFTSKNNYYTYNCYLYLPYTASSVCKFYNNTIVDQVNYTYSYGFMAYAYGTYGNIEAYNNCIYRAGTSTYYLMYLYTDGFGTKLKMDYNNIYSNQTSSFGCYNAYNGITYNTFPAMKAGLPQMNQNSLSYPPVFTNLATGDLSPVTSSPNNWSLQGRGVHIANNGTDINGNARALTTSQGVPDIGAYEFTPDAGVLPPTCVATPALPVAGGTQTFTFGFDTVQTITWDAAATVPTSTPAVRQYTGTIPPSLSTINPTNMYFYTDVQTSPNADYVANTYYKDPWMGTIAAESALHLAKKDGSNPWIGYPLPGSGANTTRNFIYSASSPKLNDYGWYTGIDVPNNAATVAIVEPTGAFCPGNYLIKVKIRNAGNNVINSVKVNWELNSSLMPQISYNTPIPVNNGIQGINDAIIQLTPTPIAFGATPNLVKVWTSLPNNVADPIAQDDTLGPITLRAALQGEYTVGGAGPDFPTPVAAINALKAAGMCGPVTFKIRQGTYVGNMDITGIVGSNAVNRLTIRADDGVAASNVIMTYGATGLADNYTMRIGGMSYVTIKNVTLQATGGSYGTVLNITGTSNDDTVMGCNLLAPTTALSSYLCAFNCNGATTNNLKFYNNNITGSYATYWGAGGTVTGLEVIGNTISSNYIGIYYMYAYNGVKINYNNITATGTSCPYGIYYVYQNGANPSEAIGNVVRGFYYGIYYLYNWSGTSVNRSKIMNNVVAYTTTGTQYAYYGLMVYYPTQTTVSNNTVVLAGPTYTSSYAGMIYFVSYTGDSLYNNVFANYQNGYALYSYFYSGYQQYCDYNNLYTSGSSLVYDGYSGLTFANMNTWRAATSGSSYNLGGADKFSISYDPGVVKATGQPDLTNPGVWSMHGRGRHTTTPTIDITGTPRPLQRQDGVPDLGAYEFEPSIAAPNATAAPAVPAPGVTQTYTFGYTTVGTVSWNTQLALTSPLNVQQYSGVPAPYNFTSVSLNKYPYFYTSITPTGLGSTYDVNLKVNYYDTWLGKIPNETTMKLAQKFSVTPWVSYNSANSSSVSAATPDLQHIYAAGVSTFGLFTGIDDNVNFSALIKVVGSTVMCTGKSVTLNANPVSSGSTTYTYQWKRNGVDIVGATNPTYIVTTGGDYTVAITATSVFPNITAVSMPVSVTVVAPPMATVSASGALIYCIGNGLTLNAPTGSNLTYQWLLNGSVIGTSATQPVSSAGSYKLVVKNIGCADTSDQTIINAGPINVDLGSDVAGCEIKGTPHILDAGFPGAKYLWSTGDTTQTISVYKGSGVYSVTVDAGPNCVGTDNVAVNLNPLPTVAGISYLRNGSQYTFSAAGATNVKNYLWIFGDGTTSTAPVVVKYFDGSMTAKLIVKIDCGNDTINMVNWAVGVSNTTGNNLEANVYPNPAKDVVTLAVKGAIMKDITIINALGEVVYRAEMGGTATEASVNVATFASGRYIIRSSTTEGIISKPFNVQR